MKRLLDEEAPRDPGAARLRELLGSVPPLGDRPARKALVRARLTALSRPPLWSGARLAIMLVSSLCAVAVVAWIALGSRRTEPTAETPAAPSATPTTPTTPSSSSPTPSPPAVEQPSLEPLPRPRPPDKRPHRDAALPPANDPAKAVRESNVSPLETAVVLDAVSALRRDRDPDRAAMLLDFYLRKYPQGMLIEEALALAIEAAKDHSSDEERRLGREYLRRFPDGRYAPLARAALHR